MFGENFRCCLVKNLNEHFSIVIHENPQKAKIFWQYLTLLYYTTASNYDYK